MTKIEHIKWESQIEIPYNRFPQRINTIHKILPFKQ